MTRTRPFKSNAGTVRVETSYQTIVLSGDDNEEWLQVDPLEVEDLCRVLRQAAIHIASTHGISEDNDERA